MTIKDEITQDVWKKSRYLLLAIHKLADMLYCEQCVNTACEMRRNSVALTANIMRGIINEKQDNYVHFFRESLNSATKLEEQIRTMNSCHMISNPEYEQLAEETATIVNQLKSFSAPYCCDIC
jgi:four helix bundle protein